MDFDALIGRVDSHLVGLFGTPATYTPVGGSAVPITAVLRRDTQLAPEGFEFLISDIQDVIDAQKSAVPTPRRGDVFVLAAVTYKVDRVFADDGYLVTLIVHRA